MKPDQELANEAKRKAALVAVKHIDDNFVVGLGSGSTAAFAIEAIGERMKREKLNLKGIPTSTQAFLLAVKSGIPITTLEEHPVIDVTIDGVDQVDPDLNLIKGMGGALAREKIVAAASITNIIIADESKRVLVLGEAGQVIPVEVLPFAAELVKSRIGKFGGNPVLREGKGKLGPVITDNGNMIIDAAFGEIKDPRDFEAKLKMIPGVVETGLFIELADIAYIGSPLTVDLIQRERKRLSS